MKKWIVAILLILPSFAWAAVNEMTVQEVFTALKSEQGLSKTLVDVRSAEEFADGHIPGAINIPHTKILEHLDTLTPLEKEGLVLFCRSGKRAGKAISELEEAGFSNLTHMKGDMQAWFKAGYEVQKN